MSALVMKLVIPDNPLVPKLKFPISMICQHNNHILRPRRHGV